VTLVNRGEVSVLSPSEIKAQYDNLDDAGKRAYRRCGIAVVAIMWASVLSSAALFWYMVKAQGADWLLLTVWAIANVIAFKVVPRLLTHRLSRMLVDGGQRVTPPAGSV
jgi:hypothetical protein